MSDESSFATLLGQEIAAHIESARRDEERIRELAIGPLYFRRPTRRERFVYRWQSCRERVALWLAPWLGEGWY